MLPISFTQPWKMGTDAERTSERIFFWVTSDSASEAALDNYTTATRHSSSTSAEEVAIVITGDLDSGSNEHSLSIPGCGHQEDKKS